MRNNMQMRLIRLLALLLLPGVTAAQAFDLLEAWQNARIQDPVFSVAQADADAGHTKQLQAQALKRPQITASAGLGGASRDSNITNARFSAPGLGAADSANFRTRTALGLDANWNIRAEYPVYDNVRDHSVNQLNHQAQLAEIRLSAEEQQLMVRVAQAYFDVLLADDAVMTLHRQLVAVASTLELAKARFEAGDAAIIETHEVQARYDVLNSQALEAHTNLQLARAALADMTGNDKDALARLSEHADIQRYATGNLEDWVSRVQNSNHLLHIQQVQQAIAHEEIDKHRAENTPVLNLVAQAGGNHLDGLGAGDANLTDYQASLGLQLVIPLYTGGMRDAKYQEAIALENKARSQMEVIRQQAVRNTRSIWQEAITGQERIRALEQAERSAEVKLDSTHLGYEVGERTTLDILNSEQELADTRLSLNRTRYQVLLALLKLSAMAGGLDESRLAEVNQALKVVNSSGSH